MSRTQLLQEALSGCQALQLQHPQVKTLQSIILQLRYLIELDSGRSQDRTRLKDIVLGVQAAREIESLDADLAEKLHQVSAEAKQI